MACVVCCRCVVVCCRVLSCVVMCCRVLCVVVCVVCCRVQTRICVGCVLYGCPRVCGAPLTAERACDTREPDTSTTTGTPPSSCDCCSSSRAPCRPSAVLAAEPGRRRSKNCAAFSILAGEAGRGVGNRGVEAVWVKGSTVKRSEGRSWEMRRAAANRATCQAAPRTRAPLASSNTTTRLDTGALWVR